MGNLTSSEKEKIEKFVGDTDIRFKNQLKELNLSNNEKDFFDALINVREEMIEQRNILDEKIFKNEGDENESVEYLKEIRAKREFLFQPQMKEIEVMFRRKFNKSMWDEYQKNDEKNNSLKKIKSKTPEVNNSREKLKLFIGALFGIFILWILFGGLLENNDVKYKTNIDCLTNPNNPYCKGNYEYQNNKDNILEESFYQNIVR